MIAWFRFALIAMLLTGIACISAIVTMQFAVHSKLVQVPVLEALPVNQAVARAASLGLDVSVGQRFYSTVLPAGRVLLQSPAAGSTVRQRSNVSVAESLGPRSVNVPDLRGFSEQQAILAVRQNALAVGTIAHLSTNQALPSTVLSQDPSALAKGAEQPAVSLLVAAPAQPVDVSYVMPNLVSHLYSQAADVLEKLGLHVSASSAVPLGAEVVLSPAMLPGTVMAQTPQSGSRIDRFTAIVLFVPPAGTPALTSLPR